MKIGFVTCVQLGLSCMESIYEAGGRLDIAITLHDTKAIHKSGRVYIDEFCANHQIPLLKIDHINDAETIAAIKNLNLDWLFIIGWSQIAGQDILDAPRMGVLGMHPTLLPTGRGRAAIPWAILKDLDKTGVTLFKLDNGTDTGPIVDQYEIPLLKTTTATELYSAVDVAHTQLIKQVLPQLLAGNVKLKEQNNTLATIWPGRKPEDGEIQRSFSVEEAERLVRATTRPYPGAFIIEEGRKIIIWSAKVANTLPTEKHLRFNDGYLILDDWEYANI